MASTRTEQVKARHSKIRILEFVEGSIVPNIPGDYLVLDEQENHQVLQARFQDDEFLGFFERHGESPVRNLGILAWAKLPATRDVLKAIYPATQTSTKEKLHIAK